MPRKRYGFTISFNDVRGYRYVVHRTSTKRHLQGSRDVLTRFRSHKTCQVAGKPRTVNFRALIHVRPEVQEEVTAQQPGL